MTDNWIVKTELIPLPAISAIIGGVAKLNTSSLIEIEGQGFLPDSVLEIAGVDIESYQIHNPNKITTIVHGSRTGTFPIAVKNNNLSSQRWSGNAHELKIVSFDIGWIDLSTAGPDLGKIESVINQDLTTKELSNSGFIRDENGISKDPSVSRQRPILLLKDYPVPFGASCSAIIQNYQVNSYPVLGIFYDYSSYQKSVLLSSLINNYKAFFYVEDPLATNKFCTISPNNLIAIKSSGVDCLIDFAYLAPSIYSVNFYEILKYGETHENNKLKLISQKKIAVQDGAGFKPAFLGLSFYSSSASILSHFKAFKIY